MSGEGLLGTLFSLRPPGRGGPGPAEVTASDSESSWGDRSEGPSGDAGPRLVGFRLHSPPEPRFPHL